MPKWEYLFVVADRIDETWFIRYENGFERINWKVSQPIEIYSNEIGQDGWELVSASYNGIDLVPHLIFKRPIP